ncbi:MAG: hypothetical protein DWQ37_13305 [Planctomycetota bacterium]|nr:MAG: hypothetical protein DWQ37_13305 [Planctomycetota bacterium]
MAPATAEPSYPRVRGLGSAVFPWFFSSTLHALLCVVLVLSWNRATQNAPAASGISLEASFLSSSSDQDEAPSIRLDEPPAEGYFEDDEPLLFAEQDPRPRGGSPALSALLNEEPAVSESGVLPASGSEIGEPGVESGIAAADQLTSEPPPPNRVQGGQALTGVFGIQGEGHKFVYVFDRSGSMDGHGGAPLAAAKSELIASLKDLGSTHQFQIIFYNEQPRIFSPSGNRGRLVFGTEQSKNLARRFVGSITASGATRHLDALAQALRMNPDVIFFLTDADEPQLTPAELAQIAQMNEGTAINTIEFGTQASAPRDNFLVRLARQNGGQYVYVDVARLPRGR